MSPDGGRVAFQLERFELNGDDRLEIAGRWFGVRGLRFVRPSLTVQTDEGERNLLALLEHKPWAAQEGDSWVAAFPWHGGSPDPGRAELSVAPSVVVSLTEQTTKKKAAPRRKPLGEKLAAAEEKLRRLEAEVKFLRDEREPLVADAKAANAERDSATSSLAEAEKESKRIGAERDAAVRERDSARAERDTAVRERDEAVRARDAALAEGADSDAIRNKSAREREAAIRERDQAKRELDEAVAARDEAVEARDEAVEDKRSALAERDAALGRGAGFPAVSAADLAREPHAPTESGVRRHVWPARAIAMAALVTVLLLVAVLLKLL